MRVKILTKIDHVEPHYSYQTHNRGIKMIRSASQTPQVARAVHGALLEVFELRSPPFSGSQQVINDLPDFQTLQWGFAGPLPQGFPSDGMSVHAGHKGRTGTVRSTYRTPQVARAVPGAHPRGV